MIEPSEKRTNTNKYCVKRVRIWSFSGPHFPALGLKAKRYGVCLRIQSECGKMETRISPNVDNVYAVECMMLKIFICKDSSDEQGVFDGL